MNSKVILGLAIVATGVVIYKTWKDSKTLRKGKLVKKTWERTMDVQEFRLTEEKGKVVPDGAEVISRSTKASVSAQTVLDNINLNTRTGRISIPDIKTETVYTYKVKKWVRVKTVKSSGIGTAPHDPEVELVNPFTTGTPELGQQRTLRSTRKYGFVFSDEDGIWHEVGATEEDYRTLDAGDTVLFKKICGAYKIVGAEPAEVPAKEESSDAKLEEAKSGADAQVIDLVSEPAAETVQEGSDEQSDI